MKTFFFSRLCIDPKKSRKTLMGQQQQKVTSQIVSPTTWKKRLKYNQQNLLNNYVTSFPDTTNKIHSKISVQVCSLTQIYKFLAWRLWQWEQGTFIHYTVTRLKVIRQRFFFKEKRVRYQKIEFSLEKKDRHWKRQKRVQWDSLDFVPSCWSNH